MSAAATAVRAVTASPTRAPRTTATTGFTNAYVDTRADEVTWRSHTYALNATMLPNTVRKTHDARTLGVTAAASNAATSPRPAPIAARTTPPASISIDAPRRTAFGSAARFE